MRGAGEHELRAKVAWKFLQEKNRKKPNVERRPVLPHLGWCCAARFRCSQKRTRAAGKAHSRAQRGGGQEKSSFPCHPLRHAPHKPRTRTTHFPPAYSAAAGAGYLCYLCPVRSVRRPACEPACPEHLITTRMTCAFQVAPRPCLMLLHVRAQNMQPTGRANVAAPPGRKSLPGIKPGSRGST